MRRHHQTKFFFLFAFVFVTFLTATGMSVSAATITYDYKNTIFGKRTKQEVAKQYSAAKNAGKTYVNADSSTYYKVPASIKSPYHQGELTDDTLASMEAMTNFYRYLVGVEPLQEKCTQNESLQYQALDRNFEFNHYISNSSRPVDMSNELWQKGFACTHNILADGYTPSGAITGWMNEGYSTRYHTWDTLGHRYALISPTNSNIQFGYSGTVAIGKNCTYNNPNYTEAFSAFPAPGYMPNNLVSPKSSAWSLDLNTSKVKARNSNNIVVTVQNLTTGDSYTCKESDVSAKISSSRISFIQPSDISGSRYTDSYRVTVTGLTDVSTGNDAAITYDVNFFDVSTLADSYVKSATPTGFSKLIVYETMKSSDDLKKIAAVLPKEIQITADSGYQTPIPVKGNWTLDEKNKCFINSADASSLPSHISDKLGKLKKISVSYEISSDYYDQYNSLGISGNVSEGNSVYMYVYRTLTSSKHSKIFKISENSDGTFSGTEKFDRYTSTEYDEEKSNASSYPYDYYKFGPLKTSDSGEYISIYYDDSEYFNEAYVCTKIKELNITHNYKDTVVKPTCTTDGYTLHKCSGCGDSYKDSIVKASGHKYVDSIVKPTCTAAGYTLHKCSVCGDSYKDSTVKALGHKTVTKNMKKATYFSAGYTGDRICSRCNKVISKGKAIKKLTLLKPVVTVKSGTKRATVSYKKVTGATKYEIKVTLGKQTKTYTTTKTSYIVKNLKSKKNYTISVRAVVTSGNKKAYSSYTTKKVLVK